LVFVFEVKEALSSFRIGHEGVLPLREDVVAFFFLVEKVQLSAGKDGTAVIGFDLIIYKFMFRPLRFTGAEPKLNFVSAVFSKEGIYCQSEWDEHVLKRVSFQFKDFLCCSNRVGNDNDVVDIFLFHSNIVG